jgi:hypothetical protein
MLQVVLIKPNKEQHNTSKQALEEQSSDLIFLYHGTLLSSLYFVLKNGFKPVGDTRSGAGLLVGGEPELSCDFECKLT